MNAEHEGGIRGVTGRQLTNVVNIGIGGSDLGPRALYHALCAFAPQKRRVHFISNVDPDDAAAVLQTVDLSRTLVGVVSKSGSTLETLTNEELAAKLSRELIGDYGNISEAGNWKLEIGI